MNKPRPTIDMSFLEKRPLSVSSLKAFRKSPKHYIQYLTEKFEPTPALILGRLIDCLVFTPERYESEFILMPLINGRTKAGQQEYEEFLLKAGGRTIITESQLEVAGYCKESLMDNNQSRQLIEGKIAVQKRMNWISKNKLPLVGYIDLESRCWDEHWVVDLKSASNADPDKFNRDAANFDYHLQCGGYLDAYHRKQYQFPYFVFMVVETTEPYNVSINFCDNNYVDRARAEWNGTLMAFEKCMRKNLFDTGYEFRLGDDMNYFTMSIPAYLKPRYLGFDEE